MKKRFIFCLASLICSPCAVYAYPQVTVSPAPAPQQMTMAAAGENPGVGFFFLSCVRQPDGKVAVKFQYPSQVTLDVEGITLSNSGKYASTATAADGSALRISKVSLGGAESDTTLCVNLPAGGKLDGLIEISGLPEDAATIGKVELKATGHYAADPRVREYSFILENVQVPRPVTVSMPAAPAAPAATVKKESAEPAKSSYWTPVATPTGGWMIEPDCVGNVKLGEKVDELPRKALGLYDVEKKISASAVDLYYGDNCAMHLSVKDGVIKGVEVVLRTARVEIGGKKFCVHSDGMSSKVSSDIATLLTMPGVKKTPYGAEYNGIRFKESAGKISSISIGE